MKAETELLNKQYFEHANYSPYSIRSFECKHCGFMVEPIRSMGNFGRVSNMKKRIRDHVREAHRELMEAARKEVA